MEDYICVTLDGVEVLELDSEDDGSYQLSSLSALIGCEAAGLRYKNKCTGNFRGVKVTVAATSRRMGIPDLHCM